MKHRSRASIKQRLPEIPETWLVAFIGFIVCVMVVMFLVFWVVPALEAAMEQ